MKKLLLMSLAVSVLLAGCTSKEQDKKIKAFWFMQIMTAMTQFSQQGRGPWPPFAATLLPQPSAAKPTPPATQPTATTTGRNTAPRPPAMQVLDVTLVDDALPGKAPHAQRVKMKQAWTTVQENNQATLKDLQTTFGENVKNKAFYITIETEKKLKQAAANANTYAAYMARQKEVLAEQEKAIQQLMLQNKASIKRIKKLPGVQ